MTRIGIIDIGSGNLSSVQNALAAVGADSDFIRNPDEIQAYAGILLPGVGSFDRAMHKLRSQGFDEPLLRAVEKGTPLLGICLGMQLLAKQGDEFSLTDGLGLIPGNVSILKSASLKFRLPHVGWNDVTIRDGNTLFRDMPDDPSFYFVHSYGYDQVDVDYVTSTVDYGGSVVATVEYDNVFGAQFHPEKSQKAGLCLLKNFVRIC